MSVSVECLAEVNDKIYFIEECCVDSKLNEIGEVDFDQSVIFNIGDQVKYLDWYEERVGCNLITKIKSLTEKVRYSQQLRVSLLQKIHGIIFKVILQSISKGDLGIND